MIDQERNIQVPPAKKTLVHRRNFLRASAMIAAGLLLRGDSAPGKRADSIPEASLPDTEGTLLSRAELAEKYHTRIYDLNKSEFPDDFVLLDFRKSAEQTELFQRLAKGKEDLRIVLVDGDYVDQKFFTPEQQKLFAKDIGTRSFLERQSAQNLVAKREWIEENKEKRVSEYEEKLAELQRMLVSNLISQDIFNVEKEALDYRYEYFRKTDLTDDELKGGKFSIGGISVITTDKDVLGIPRRKSTVFIAVRNMPNRRIFTSGNERLEVPTNQIFYSRIFGAPLAPAPDQSEPILGNFTVGDDPDYPLEASLPGTTLRHELKHVKGLNHPDTDLEVITDLREARQKFENGDDSGYWLEFRTPAGSTIT